MTMFCKPFWIVDFTNETYYEELVYFFHYYFVSLWSEYSVNQAMFIYSFVNTVHVFTASGKDA